MTRRIRTAMVPKLGPNEAYLVPNLPRRPGERFDDWQRRIAAGAVKITNVEVAIK